MTHLALLLCSLTLLCLTGCEVDSTATLPSVRDDRVIGTWKALPKPGEKADSEEIIVTSSGEEYAATVGSEKKDHLRLRPLAFGNLFQFGGTDSCSVSPSKMSDGCWTIGKLEFSKGRADVYLLDAARVLKDVKAGVISIAHYDASTQFLGAEVSLTAPKAELERFLKQYTRDPSVFKLVNHLRKLK